MSDAADYGTRRQHHHRRHTEPREQLDPTRTPFDQPAPEHPAAMSGAPEHVTAAIIKSTGEYTEDIARYLHRLGVLAERRDQPADIRPIVLTAGVPKFTDQRGNLPSRSIGLLNPSAFTVWLGLGGMRPDAAAQAPAVPASAAAVFPVMAEDLELAADPVALGANSAVVYLFRYASVQPLSFTAL